MSSIEAVIARSRRPGGFSERKQFTVARQRGIQKLRKFALASPGFYILELVQAAIANQAKYIDIQGDGTRCTFAYIGGGLHEHELAQLFDFLFASKDRTDIGHVRELALGVNAAMLFSPKSITIESGDGTLAGTTRMVISGTHDQVEVGRPDRPLSGTYVAIEGMQRSRSDDAPERGVIETKCLTAPIPILVNGVPLFGLSSQRVPGLFGYKKVLSFDEGDLYGTIGVDPNFGNATFELLTWGVAIQSKSHRFHRQRRLGGVVCFDRLRKTADHSGIVEDERLQEMWIRLEPYAQQLLTGKTNASVYSVRRLDGEVLSLNELRATLRDEDRVVLVPEGTSPDTPRGQRAAEIGRRLEAVVLRGNPRHAPAMRALAGGRIQIVRPWLQDDRDVTFYASPPAGEPARPWLIPPIEVPAVPTAHLAAWLHGVPESAQGSAVTKTAAQLGAQDVHAFVYTPEAMAVADTLKVEVRTTGRVLWQGELASSWPGHVLVIDVAEGSAHFLREPIDQGPDAPSAAQEFARLMARHAAPWLAKAFERAVASLRDLTIEPGSTTASVGLVAAVRSVLPRLRVFDGRPRLDLSQLEALEIDLLGLPLLQTLDGRRLDLRALARMTAQTGGLVYGTIPSVPADVQGLDRSKILKLTEADERQLVALLGESTYVRVDRRDVLAEHDGVQCRDLAVGLHPYSDFPLLVEGVDPSTLPVERQAEIEQALVGQLVRRFVGLEPPPPENGDAWARDEWEECRRQACRQLQYYVCRRGHNAGPVVDLPLFMDADEQPRAFRELWPVLQSGEGLTLLYGHAHGPAVLGELARAALDGWSPSQSAHRPDTLLGTPFLHGLLASLGKANPAFDFELDPRGSTRPGQDPNRTDALVCQVPIELPGVRGVLGVPRESTSSLDIVVLLPDGDRARVMGDLAREHGVVGWLRLDEGEAWTDERLVQTASAIRAAARKVLEGLLEALPKATDEAERARWVSVLLAYVDKHLVLNAQRPDRIIPDLGDPLVAKILSLPLFPSRYGGPMPGLRLVRRCCGLLASGHADPTPALLADLDPALAPHLRRFVTEVLHPSRVVRSPGFHPQPEAPPTQPVRSGPVDAMTLQYTLSHWLQTLRPDVYDGEPARVFVVVPDTKPGAEPDISTAGGSVFLDARSWLATWALQRGSEDPQALAFCLLTIYAQINEVLDRVTHTHELQFQRAVAQALLDGRLVMLRPAFPTPEPEPQLRV